MKVRTVKGPFIYTGDTPARQGGSYKKIPLFRKGDSCGFEGSSPLLLQNFFFVLKQMNIPLWIGNSDAFLIEAFLDGFG
jgi:hypothetical protein